MKPKKGKQLRRYGYEKTKCKATQGIQTSKNLWRQQSTYTQQMWHRVLRHLRHHQHMCRRLPPQCLKFVPQNDARQMSLRCSTVCACINLPTVINATAAPFRGILQYVQDETVAARRCNSRPAADAEQSTLLTPREPSFDRIDYNSTLAAGDSGKFIR